MPTNTNFPPAAPAPVDPWTPRDLTLYAKTTDVMPKAASITGYDATKAQTLQHDATGALKWVDNATA